MTTPDAPAGRLKPALTKLRRAQLVIGLGFFAAVAGAIIGAAVLEKVQPHLGGASGWVLVLVGVVVARFWVVVALPGIAYGAARVLPLSPTSTAFGAALTGELFYVALDLVTVGLAGLYPGLGALLLRIATLALGILLTLRAIRAGRAAADRGDARARQLAESKKAEYAQFAAEAERLAARSEQRIAESAAPTPAPPADAEKAG